jgi:hypothetical protein
MDWTLLASRGKDRVHSYVRQRTRWSPNAAHGTESVALRCKSNLFDWDAISNRIPGVTLSERPAKYRRFAKECLQMAAAAKDERSRGTLLFMAQVWFRLAQQEEHGCNDSNPKRTRWGT